MPVPRDHTQTALNTSIRLFRKKSAFNTSRRILQKSINRSICAASLKSNNASLAKRVAELQLEVNAERTAKFTAQMEACNLRVELSRLRAHLEAVNKIKENQLKLREVIVSMFDAGMAVMRSLCEASELPDGMGNSDQTACYTSNLLADTLVDPITTNQADVAQPSTHQLKEQSGPLRVSDILKSVDSEPPADNPPLVGSLPRATVTVRNPVPPILTDSTTILTEPNDPHPVTPSSHISSSFVRVTPVLVQLPSPENISFHSNKPEIASHSPLCVQEEKCLPSPIQPIVPTQQKTVSAVITPVSPQRAPSSSTSKRKTSLNSPVYSRTHLKRQARAKAKPIIDEPSWAFMSPNAKPPTRSKRKRIVHPQDSDEESSAVNTEGKALEAEVFKKPAPPTNSRTVEVHIDRPGQVVFRAESKNNHVGHPLLDKRPTGTKALKPRSKRKTLLTRPSSSDQPSKPKSVFDLSVNQTANMSVLPATLDELRKKESSKKQAVVHPVIHIQRSPTLLQPLPLNTAQMERPVPKDGKARLLVTSPRSKENSNPNISETNRSPRSRLSMQLTPLEKLSCKAAHSPVTKSIQGPGPRYRRLYLDDHEDEDIAVRAPTVKAKRSTRTSSRR